MGAAYTCSTDNDNLVDTLKSHKFINTKTVERVFRAVDRGDYIWPSQRYHAYKDISSKIGNIHLSAPCIYARAMEGLALEPGMSFLNIGSGTGYLSTMAGLILGDKGTNHGIEVHEDCLNYAYEHLEEFKAKSLHVDVFEFCEPVFQLGNFLNVIPNRRYDRVYCGAACPEEYEKFVKKFVKVRGILVVPYKDQLLRITRTGEKTWITQSVLAVSFATLLPPEEGSDKSLIQLPMWNPLSLQELCRNLIRSHLRQMVWAENTLNTLERKRHMDWVIRDQSRRETVSLEMAFLRAISHFVRNSSIPPVHAGGDCLSFYIDRGTSENGSDSEDELASELVHFLGCRCRTHESENENREAPNAVSRTRRNAEGNSADTIDEEDEDEDEESMEVGAENLKTSKESEDVEMDERNESAEGGSKNNRSASSNLKRKSSDRESEEDESSDDSDDSDNGDLLNGLLIKRMFAMRNSGRRWLRPTTVTSDFSSDDDKDVARSCTKTFNSSETREESDPTSSNVPTLEENQIISQTDSHAERNERAASCVSTENKVEEASNESKDSNDKSELDKDHSDASSNDEIDDTENCRRDYRPGQKRRSERKSVSSESEGSSISGKKSYKSDSSASDNTKNSGDSFSSDETAEDCFVYMIRNESFSLYMMKKIRLLPLPPTLRMYINYNRELSIAHWSVED